MRHSTKLFIVAAFASMPILGSAFAADMPVKALKAPPPVIFTWTGCYIGGNAGYQRMSDGIHLSGTDTDGGGFGAELADGSTRRDWDVHSEGFIGGGQVGCNWQNGRFVWGIEADLDGAGGRSSASQINLPQPPFPPRAPILTTVSNKLDWLGTVRGRAGFTPTERLLLYATGGLAVGETELSVSSLCPTCGPPRNAFGTSSDTGFGWAAGFGAEWAFLNNWSAKVEYLHYDLGTNSVGLIYNYGVNTSTLTARNRERGDLVRAGLNWHFGGGPVVAKY